MIVTSVVAPRRWILRVPMIILCFTWLSTAAVGQAVLRVDMDAPSGGDGLTWPTAFTDIQDALTVARDLAAPVDIWIAEGTYRADHLEGDPFRSFDLFADLRLLGGFAGHEDQADQRDWITHPVVLDGDLYGDDFPDFEGYTNNTRHLVKAHDLSGPATLDGLTLRAGFAYNSPGLLRGGGAVFALRSDVFIANCRFEENWAGYNLSGLGNYGGAVYLKGSGLLEVRNSVFVGNRGGAGGGALAGLGRDCGMVDVRLHDCQFLNNTTRHEGGYLAVGGAVSHDRGNELTIDGCYFEGNDANFVGALTASLVQQVTIRDSHFHANTCDGRAVVNLDRSDNDDANPAVLERCLFTENRIILGNLSGSALRLLDTIGHVSDCQFLDNVNLWVDPDDGSLHGVYTVVVAFNEGHRFVNCLLAGNHAAESHGFLFHRAGVSLVNVTVADNSSAVGGSSLVESESAVTVSNSVFWGNRRDTGVDSQLPGTADEASNVMWYDNPPEFDHCIVEGWTGDLGGTANLGLDPNFVGDGDQRLRWPSPAIDTGNNDSVPVDVLTDLDGEIRIRDGDGDGTATVDMGAYEYLFDPTGVADPVVSGGEGRAWLSGGFATGRATINFGIPQAGPVRLSVFDLRGRRLNVLVDGWLGAGEGVVIWDGGAASGQPVPSGIYLLKLETGRQQATGRVVLIR